MRTLSRKSLLITILSKLVGYWSLADPFLQILQTSDDEDLEQKLVDILIEAV